LRSPIFGGGGECEDCTVDHLSPGNLIQAKTTNRLDKSIIRIVYIRFSESIFSHPVSLPLFVQSRAGNGPKTITAVLSSISPAYPSKDKGAIYRLYPSLNPTEMK
jgi:hypothetical protein